MTTFSHHLQQLKTFWYVLSLDTLIRSLYFDTIGPYHRTYDFMVFALE